MKKVRLNIFETNSSSTHSLYILPLEDYNKWDNENYFFDMNNMKVINKEELLKILEEFDIPFEDFVENKDYIQNEFYIFTQRGYDDYIGYDFDTFSKHDLYNKNGEEVVIFGFYGYSG